MKFQFGSEVRDVVSGFTGIVTGFCSYITGCEQYLVQPESVDKTKKPDALWLDEDRLQIITPEKVRLAANMASGYDQLAPVK